MQIDTAGTYTLKYTAEDECGNVTEVTREVVAEVISYKTVLFADGTFIINEKSTDRDANVALHGIALFEYDPFDPNGATDIAKYIFAGQQDRPWRGRHMSEIKVVECGSPIQPYSLKYWFANFSAVKKVDFSLLDMSRVTNTEYLFSQCTSLTEVTFNDTKAENLELIDGTFNYCITLPTVDISSFKTDLVTNMDYLFYTCQQLTTIYASDDFIVPSGTTSSSMFGGCNALVGGSGTTFSSNHTNGEYARIDNPPTAPGYFTLKSA